MLSDADMLPCLRMKIACGVDGAGVGAAAEVGGDCWERRIEEVVGLRYSHERARGDDEGSRLEEGRHRLVGRAYGEQELVGGLEGDSSVGLNQVVMMGG